MFEFHMEFFMNYKSIITNMEFFMIYKSIIIKIQNILWIGNILFKQVDMEEIMHMQMWG